MTSAGLTAVDALGHWRRVWRLELGARAALAASLMDRRRRLRWRARSRLERSDEGSAILMRVLSSWMRTAILRNAQRMVSKVAVRQIERFGAALLSSCRSQSAPM